MKWTKKCPSESGWYWHRADHQDAPKVVVISRNIDGELVVGSDTVEDGIHRPPRKLDMEFSVYPDEEWSDSPIPEPTG